MGEDTWAGTIYYWDWKHGDDANSGLSPTQAKKTLKAAIEMYNAVQHDFIFALSGDSERWYCVND